MAKKNLPKAIKACKLNHNCLKFKGGSIKPCCYHCDHFADCAGSCLNVPDVCGQLYTHVRYSHDPLDRGK